MPVATTRSGTFDPMSRTSPAAMMTPTLAMTSFGSGGDEAGGQEGEREAGGHILRHTFCSHLAMRGAPARAIQELEK
jgi:site-specific recombinase XerD